MIKKYASIILWFSLGITSCYAQISQSAGASTLAMGNASVGLPNPFSSINNQAAMAFMDNGALSVFSRNQFFVDGVNQISAAGILPTKSGAFGLALNYEGFDLFNESKVGVSYGLLLAEDFSIGAQLTYYSLSIEQYGSTNSISFDAAIMYQAFDDLYVGAQIINPVQQDLTAFNTDNLPTTLKVGFGWLASDQVTITGELLQQFENDPVVNAGIEYRVIDAVALRTGISTNPTLNSFGVGFLLKQIQLDIAANYHQVLGISPALSLTYKLKSKS